MVQGLAIMLVGIVFQISMVILFRISLKSLHYAQFCSFYAYDSIITDILHVQVNC